MSFSLHLQQLKISPVTTRTVARDDLWIVRWQSDFKSFICFRLKHWWEKCRTKIYSYSLPNKRYIVPLSVCFFAFYLQILKFAVRQLQNEVVSLFCCTHVHINCMWFVPQLMPTTNYSAILCMFNVMVLMSETFNK